MTDFDCDLFADQLAELRQRMADACSKAGRDPGDVQLLPVTKTRGPEIVCAAAGQGLTVFGENRVQEARQKIPLCHGHLEWHLIGHLQRNKAKDAVRLFSTIHSVDSVRLLETVDSAAAQAGVRPIVFVEVNVSGEPQKFGVTAEDLVPLLEAANNCMNVEVAGLMTMPPFMPEPEDVRPFFSRLRELRDNAAEATGLVLGELSMGMSHDFDVAIEEGATWVRVGSMLFGQR